jgi:hypothetical protein
MNAKRAATYNASQPWDVADLPPMFLSRIPEHEQRKDSPVFAIKVAEAQGNLGLKPDGMLGPRTLRALREIYVGAPSLSFEPDGAEGDNFVVGGQPVHTTLDVYHGATFEARARTKSPHQVVLHESVTDDPDIFDADDTTERILRRKGCGVHIMIGPDGSIVQHQDLLTESVAHAGKHNSGSIGIEIVGPYYKAKPPHWTETIDAPWAHKRRYALPPRPQMAAMVQVLTFILSQSRLNVPNDHNAIVDGKFVTGRHPSHKSAAWIRSTPGIFAHCLTAHADGVFPALVAYYALGEGHTRRYAYDRAVERLTGARGRVGV